MSETTGRSRLVSLAVVVAAGLLLASLFIFLLPGAGGGCPTPSVELEATVTPAGMQPQQLVICRGQQADLTLTSEVSGIFHVHGFDDHPDGPILAEVRAGEVVSFEFEASRSGQFPAELHSDGGDLTVGVLFVNEP